MRKRRLRFTLILVTLVGVGSALAAGSFRYKWRDAEGNLHYTDSLPVDAGVRGYEVINAQGIVVKRVEPALTPDQRAAAKVAATAARAEEAAAERQRREDAQLLAANPTEQDLLESQRQQLALMDQQIAGLNSGLASQERSLTDLLGRAAELERSGRSVSSRLTAQIASARKEIEAQHANINRHVDEREAAKQEFARELEHYRALRDKYNPH
jgi:hypothetical protein